MKPIVHLFASASVSTALYAVTHSAPMAGVSFFCGFLIDLDHFFEYFREYGVVIDRKKFFRVFHENRFQKLWLIFHAWEWVLALLIIAFLSGWNELTLGILIGMVHHLTLDQIGNGATKRGYLLIYRALHGFSLRVVIKDSVVQKKRNCNEKINI